MNKATEQQLSTILDEMKEKLDQKEDPDVIGNFHVILILHLVLDRLDDIQEKVDRLEVKP